MKRFLKYTQKFISVLIILMILLSSVAFISVFALDTSDNTQQVEYTGGWNPSEYTTEGKLYKDRIAVSKTVAPTEYENYFDISLRVVAKPRVIDSSVDVVVVMDVSNTMNSTHQGLGPNDKGYDINDTKLAHAKAALDNFIDLYSVDKNLSNNRRFGLVTFNSHANTVVPLAQLNTAEKAQQIKTAVDAITAPTENRVRFTNIEGGLQLAHNLLKDSEAVFKYVIFVTDGLPTTYIESERNSTTQIIGYDTYMTGSYNAGKAGTDGYFADSITQKICTHGVNYSDKAAQRADDVAAKITAAGINIFSIGVNVDVQSVPDYLSLANNTAFTTVDRASENIVVGNTTETYKTWLCDAIAGGPMIEKAQGAENIHRYSSGNSFAEFTAAFTNILKDMELIPAETMEEVYTLDPMSEYVEFVCFYDVKGNPTEHVVNSRNGKDVAVFNDESKTIKWWLRSTQSWYIDDIGNYVLSLTYRVRLKNEEAGFDASTAFDTNKETTLYFKTKDFSTGEPLFGDNSINYPMPQVEGYKGTLRFTKMDALTQNPLGGAEFTLRHNGNSCNVCHGDAVIGDMTAKSNRRGVVEFENIPSGHEYGLIETKAPEGYKRGSHHYVNISYGRTYFDSVLVTEEVEVVVSNYTIEPVEIQLTAHTNMIGRDITAEEFHFSLTGVFEFGNKFHEIAACDENGMVTFHEIRFEQVGTYSFTLSEVKGKDTSVIYDTKEYNIEIEVGLSEDGLSYTVETIIDGEAVENDTVPAPFKFTNTLREAGKAQLEFEKTLDGEAPQDGVFSFNLSDEDGNILQTKSTVKGKAAFDEIEYTKEGVYRYTIAEDNHDEMFEEIFFDHSVYSAVVTVTAPKDSSAFETKVEYFLEGEKAEVPVFRNEIRKAATLKLDFVKTLDGLAPNKDRFAFEVRDNTGEVIEKVKNAEEGVISLSTLKFDKVGYFTYTVNEVIGEEENIVYDNTVYCIYVTVEPHHNVSNYYIEVDIKKNAGAEEELVVHAHGINIEMTTNGELVFVNSTKETEKPTEPPTEAPTQVATVEPTGVEGSAPTTIEPITDATSATDVHSTQKGFDAPNTGSNNTLIWLALLLVVGAGMVFVVRIRRKEENA